MSILIKNMTIPKQGRVTLQIGADGAVYVVDKCEITAEKYEKNFEVFEVPTPHRRLIEEPKRLSYDGLAYISPADFIGTAEYFLYQIKSMPTIIEAEET